MDFSPGGAIDLAMSGYPLPHAMVLAAGLGTRMRPLTDTLPKPLVRVAGKPLLDRVVENAVLESIPRLVINVHHHADQMERHIAALRARHAGVEIVISDERATLRDTGGAIAQALPSLDTDPILVMNADSIWPLGADRPIARLIETYHEHGAQAALLCARPHQATGFRRSHDFCLDPNRRITSDSGAPVIYAGVALIKRSLIAAAGTDKFSLVTLFDQALEAGRMVGAPLLAPWLHVGDPAAIGEAEKVLEADQ